MHHRPRFAALLAWLHHSFLLLPRLVSARIATLGTAAVAMLLVPACRKAASPTYAHAPDTHYETATPAPKSAPPSRGGDAGSSSRDATVVMEDEAAPELSSRMGTTADPSDSRPVRRRDRRRSRSRHARRTTPSGTSAPVVRPAPTPGLGTSYGEQRHSSVVNTAFMRDSDSPDTVLSLWYNDWAGIESMAAAYGRRNTTNSTASSSDGSFVVQLVDEHGRTLPASDIEGRRYAAGLAGARYKIRISNNSAYRFEVVASVDGLDVIDGSEAAFHKRGYVLDAWSSITIDGWRTSDDTVASFRFSDIEDSYAERTGKGRNIGVVGVAFFHERGAAPWQELNRRHSSEPFPGRYTPPPPPRWR
ncbi:MAG: hypothetical protein AAF721_27540 [Myxococcota bacterium]